MSVTMPPTSEGQRQGWLALLDLHDALPTGWVLVGGQMVHLWCAERGVLPARPTDDLDAVLDVRANPRALLDFTTVLKKMGFRSQGETWNGHQHRWTRGEAQIDVLIPRWLGERAASRKGADGGTTLETPGAQQARRGGRGRSGGLRPGPSTALRTSRSSSMGEKEWYAARTCSGHWSPRQLRTPCSSIPRGPATRLTSWCSLP